MPTTVTINNVKTEPVPVTTLGPGTYFDDKNGALCVLLESGYMLCFETTFIRKVEGCDTAYHIYSEVTITAK